MKAHSISTDNASVKNKLKLRKEAVKNLKELKVLDLYAGKNVLWNHFDKARYFGIEKEKGKGRNLYGDNIKVIPSLDLSDFNVIDCDSYGIPVQVIDELYKNPTLKKGTIIIYTAISNSMSSLSITLLEKYNMRKMFRKCESLLSNKSHELFYGFLYDLGVRQVREYQEESKNFVKRYGYFIVK